VYDRQFLKLEDGRIIPLILCGDNNVYETMWNGRQRRSRDWQASYWQHNVIPALAPEEIMKKIHGYADGTTEQHFMRDGKWVDDAAFIRFFKNGIKEAKTLKELEEERIFWGSICAYLSVWTKVDGKPGWDRNQTTELDCYLNSDEAIISFLEKTAERLEKRTADEDIYVCIGYSGNQPLRKPKRARKPKERLTGEFYVVTFNGNRYVTRLTRGGLRHSEHAMPAKQFETEKDARKWIEQRDLARRFRGTFEVEKIIAKAA